MWHNRWVDLLDLFLPFHMSVIKYINAPFLRRGNECKDIAASALIFLSPNVIWTLIHFTCQKIPETIWLYCIFTISNFFPFLFVFALLYALRIDVAPCGQLWHVVILATLRSNLSQQACMNCSEYLQTCACWVMRVNDFRIVPIGVLLIGAGDRMGSQSTRLGRSDIF